MRTEQNNIKPCREHEHRHLAKMDFREGKKSYSRMFLPKRENS